MSRAFKLFRLQQTDTQLDQANARLAEIERRLAQNAVLQAAIQGREQARAAAHATHTALRSAEEEVAAQQKRIEQNQASLYGGKVSNPKELQDLQLESEAFARRLSELEDVQLNAMDAHEQEQANLKAAEENLEAVKAQQAVEHTALLEEQAGLQEEAARLLSQRASAREGVEATELGTYESLRASKNGVAVAKVQSDTCSACGAELSAARAQAARSADELTRCDNCKRILYAG